MNFTNFKSSHLVSILTISAIAIGSMTLSACKKPSAKVASNETTPQIDSTKIIMDSKTNKLGESDKVIIASNIPEHYSKIKIPEFNYQPPAPKDYRVEINQNVVAYLYPSSQLPLIDMSVVVPRNNFANSSKEVAKLSLLSSMYKIGGTEDLTPEALEDSLEFLSAAISASIGDFHSSFGLNSLTKDFDNVLKLTKDIIQKPRFDKERFNLQKTVLKQALEHRFDKSPAISDKLYTYALYKSHPVFWMSKAEEIMDITVKDLKELNHNRFMVEPGKKIIVGISGDFKKEEMVTKLKDFFKPWDIPLKQNKMAPPPLPTHKDSKGKIYIVDKKAQQAIIKFGQPFIKRPNPDYYKATIASYILGAGGFTSRLKEKIRTKEGLVYTITSFTNSNYKYPVSSGVFLQTKMESANYAIKLAYDEINRLIKDGISDKELQGAKNALSKSLPSLFDTPSSSVNAFVMSEFWGRDLNHFSDYPKKLEAVTKQDVVDMIKKYFTPEKMTLTVVGSLEEIKKRDEKSGLTIDDLGEVIVVPMDSLILR